MTALSSGCLFAAQEVPGKQAARFHWHNFDVSFAQSLCHAGCFARQANLAPVARQTIEVGTMEARESLELVESTGGIEGFRIQLDGVLRAVDARTSTRSLLGM